MSTIEASPETAHDEHGHDHGHYPFLAHHFDTPEQQFDSGKLGIWLFLVTEILFFSGMFTAYAIFRMLRPDVFEGCSEFLNTKLGAINTGVLLFSSLTMAWAVRCAQTEQRKGLTAMLAATLSCAMIFLGVKAIEYSHKWGMGLMPAGLYHYDPANPHPHLIESSEPLELGWAVAGLNTKLTALNSNNQDYVAGDKLQIKGVNPDHSSFETELAVDQSTTLNGVIAAINQAAHGATASISEQGYLQYQADVGGSEGLELSIADASGNTGVTAFPEFHMVEKSPNYLFYLCVPFALLLLGVVVWLIVAFIRGNEFQVALAKPLSVVCLSFFLGVGLGAFLESGGSEAHGSDHAAAGHAEHGSHGDEHAEEHAEQHGEEAVATAPMTVDDQAVLERLASEQTNSGVQSELAAIERQRSVAGSSIVTDQDQITGGISQVEGNVLTKSTAGVFFSIYYCMTGVHAIHIIGGIIVLVWLLVRSVRQDFNRLYFGPVDYVGLYWHLVDLIWIYLFPLLYLIR